MPLRESILNGKEFIDDLSSSNSIKTWILRFVGVLVIISAFNSLFPNLDKDFKYDECFGSMEEQRDLLLVVKVPAMAEIFGTAIKFEQDYLQSLAPSKDYKFTDKKAMQDRVQR